MRVADMTQHMCTFLGVAENDAMVIHVAAHLHDIGKIGIDDAILRKEGPLNDGEWEAVKEHPLKGFTILHKVDMFSGIAEIVLRHHERWDGKGYPSGIRGTDVPYGSRIIAVADSIDAMMSRRSYRTGLTSEQCRIEIEKNSGIMYDPDVAAAVLLHWEEIVAVRTDFGLSRVEEIDGTPSVE